jgi:UDP-N-acetylglucosamine transferase subunit ALG13
VTIGLLYGFDRLIREMDEIAGGIAEEVIMQIGETAYESKNARYFRFASAEKMDQLYEDARVVVCHAGVGSILTALEHGKPIIAVPRRKKYGEHVDDHQLDIAGEMEKEGRITVVCDVGELEDVLMNASTNSAVKVEKDNRLVRGLKEYLSRLNH